MDKESVVCFCVCECVCVWERETDWVRERSRFSTQCCLVSLSISFFLFVPAMHTLSIKGVEPEGKRLKWREKDKLRELTRLLTLEKYMMFLIMCQVNKTKETETRNKRAAENSAVDWRGNTESHKSKWLELVQQVLLDESSRASCGCNGKTQLKL